MKHQIKLPAVNKKALGLRLTDQEWEAVLNVCGGDERIVRAWVFGSRATGLRTSDDLARPPDIDLAIEPTWRRDEDGTEIRLAADFKDTHAEVLRQWNIEVDWHGLEDSSDSFHAAGVQVWPR